MFMSSSRLGAMPPLGPEGRGPNPTAGKSFTPQVPMPAAPKRPMPGRVLGSFKKGGKVKKTGPYELHAGEKVVSVAELRKAK